MILKFIKRQFLPDPQPGEVWYYTNKGSNPWDEPIDSKVYVIDVKDGWVAYGSAYGRVATEHRRNPLQYEDSFMKISNFKDTYNRGVWHDDDNH